VRGCVARCGNVHGCQLLESVSPFEETVTCDTRFGAFLSDCPNLCIYCFILVFTSKHIGSFKVRTASRRLTLGMRFERFLLDVLALLDRFVAIVISSFDLDCSFNLPGRCCCVSFPGLGPKTII